MADNEPTILSPSGIDLDRLDRDAVKATQRLVGRGHEAYLVGGCVRDLLLGRTPKDFDIATSARPQQVKRTFPRNCRIIGRRFKLAHLHFDRNTKILEVSTFRRTPDENESDDLLITRDNEFGSAEEDALRRDFTVNALFLDPTSDTIVDHAEGLPDIRAKVIRTIGDPLVRFREDPVRILRAVKFAGRLGFSIEPATFAAMAETAGDLTRAAPPRVLEEILRLLRGGHALASFQLLRDVGAIKFLVPVVADFLSAADHDHRTSFWRLLDALDRRVQDGSVPSNPVLLGTLMVWPVLAAAEAEPDRSASSIAEELLGSLAQDLKLPRRDAGCLKRICGTQHRFAQRQKNRRFRPEGFVRGPYFPEALELFALRVDAGDACVEDLERWREIASHHGRSPGDSDEVEGASPRRKRRRRKSRSTRERGEAEGDATPSEDDTPARPEPPRKAPPKKSRERKRTDESSDEFGFGAAIDDESPPSDEDSAEAAERPEPEEKADRPKKKRRRRRRKSGSTARTEETDGEAKASADGDEGSSESSPPSPKPGRRSRGSPPPAKEKAKKARKAKKGRKRSGSDRPHDVDVVPRFRDRRGKVEVIEPPAMDVSAFDIELDPKRVPTFGTIVEGKGRPKKRAPRVPEDGRDDYKPPPPPGSDAPPPSRDDSDDPDTFGDW